MYLNDMDCYAFGTIGEPVVMQPDVSYLLVQTARGWERVLELLAKRKKNAETF